jgi:hypothetical protein
MFGNRNGGYEVMKWVTDKHGNVWCGNSHIGALSSQQAANHIAKAHNEVSLIPYLVYRLLGLINRRSTEPLTREAQ